MRENSQFVSYFTSNTSTNDYRKNYFLALQTKIQIDLYNKDNSFRFVYFELELPLQI